jgi:hypothetical protein
LSVKIQLLPIATVTADAILLLEFSEPFRLEHSVQKIVLKGILIDGPDKKTP